MRRRSLFRTATQSVSPKHSDAGMLSRRPFCNVRWPAFAAALNVNDQRVMAAVNDDAVLDDASLFSLLVGKHVQC